MADFHIGRYTYYARRNHYNLHLNRQSDKDDIVKSYDHLLHQSLDKIFHDRCLGNSDQIKEFLRGLKHGDQDSTIKPILEQEPALSEYFSKEELGRLSLLWISVLAGYEKSAELLVRSGADVNEPFGRHDPQVIDKKWTVLHLLLNFRPFLEHERLICLVTDHGADLHAQDFEGRTVLHHAVEQGQVKISEMFLLKHGADLQARDRRGKTVLHYAQIPWEGQVQMTEMLLDKGADVNAADNDGITPLLNAAAWNPEADELMPLLIRHGADVFAKSRRGLNILHYLAAWHPQDSQGRAAELVRFLVEKGVSLDDQSVDKQFQPIHLAALCGNNELVKLYLDHGANVNAKTKDGESPLHLAPRSGKNTVAVVETLLKRGANVDLKTILDRTALHFACKYAAWLTTPSPNETTEIESVIRLFLSAGADVLAEDSRGKTPLALFTFSENIDWPEIRLIIKVLALKKAFQPSIKLKDERIIKRYQKLQDYYRECFQEIDKMKITRFIRTCTFFDLLAQSNCQISALMRNPEFETKFGQYDLNEFPIYCENILRAYECAQRTIPGC